MPSAFNFLSIMDLDCVLGRVMPTSYAWTILVLSSWLKLPEEDYPFGTTPKGLRETIVQLLLKNSHLDSIEPSHFQYSIIGQGF